MARAHPSSIASADRDGCSSLGRQEDTMPQSLDADSLREPLARLQAANLAFDAAYPGESGERQAVHTVYGGAHLFKADTARKMGELALRTLDDYYPNFAVLARALGFQGADDLPETAEG